MKIKQILSVTFWLIMAIHFIVFTIIGFISGDWRLILIFAMLFALTIIVKFIIYFIKRKSKNE